MVFVLICGISLYETFGLVLLISVVRFYTHSPFHFEKATANMKIPKT